VLTAECIRNDGLKIAGWVANQVDPHMPMLEANIDSLNTLLDVPFIGTIPRLKTAADAGEYLDLSVLDL
jgi:dethiobiotin synthetase